ncbi:glycosyltransferase family 2 protein, partial [Oceanicola sp. S124]|uniref:glycosyltransferase family 2 protein n=1 Tax=Oceanicola sp. S124 TaxID=1042378 RepID=UPI0002557D5B
MKLTIIIPTHDRLELLRQAVASVLRQRCEATLDVLVIDDGSQDGTEAWLAEQSARAPALRWIRQDNAGVTAARNTGLRNLAPDTDLVTFLDSDDTFPEGYFAKAEACFAPGQDVDLTYGRLLMVEAIDPVTLEPAEGARSVWLTGIQLSSAILRRGLVDRVGLFDETLRQSEDVDFLLRAFETGPKIAQSDMLCLYYRRHPGNMTKNLEETRRCFALALLKSMQRRRRRTP